MRLASDRRRFGGHRLPRPMAQFDEAKPAEHHERARTTASKAAVRQRRARPRPSITSSTSSAPAASSRAATFERQAQVDPSAFRCCSRNSPPPQISMRPAGTASRSRRASRSPCASPTNGEASASTNVPLVFVGYGVTAPERGWDDFKGVDVKGKVLVVLVNDPDFEGGEGDFGGKAMTYYGRWTYKYEEAARRGAAGVLVVHETAPASYGWATVKNSNTNTMFDIVRQNPAPSIRVRRLDPARRSPSSSSAPGLDFEQAKAAAAARLPPVPLKAR